MEIPVLRSIVGLMLTGGRKRAIRHENPDYDRPFK